MTRHRFSQLLICLTVLHVARPVAVRANAAVYTDALASGWQDWSWGGVTRNFANVAPVHSGTASIAVTYTGSWSGLQLGGSSALDVSTLDTFRFYVHGGSSGAQIVQVQVGNSTTGIATILDFTPVAGTWTQVDVPLRRRRPPARQQGARHQRGRPSGNAKPSSASSKSEQNAAQPNRWSRAQAYRAPAS
jgi:hypothetical protein